jgi:hypothetical protein
VGTTRTLLLQWLDATSQAARAPDRWVSAQAVARRLSPAADADAIARDLNHLSQLGLVERGSRNDRAYFRVTA